MSVIAPAEFLTFSAKLVKLCTELNASGDSIVWSIPKINERTMFEYDVAVTELNADQQTQFLKDLEARLAEVKADNAENKPAAAISLKEFLMKRDALKTDTEAENRMRVRLIEINKLLNYSVGNRDASLATFDNKAKLLEQQEYLRLKVAALRNYLIKKIRQYYENCQWNAAEQSYFEVHNGGFDCGLDAASDEQIEAYSNEMIKGNMI
jgi:predicted nucleotide-binding protein (sugar kinase/HSP70/actin superfamily)